MPLRIPPLAGWTRRQLIWAGLAAPAVAVAQEHHHVTPRRVAMRTDEGGTYDEAALQRALATKVEALAGLDPLRALTTFDTGKVSRLPSGQTLREYRVVAQDRTLEVAPGISFPAWTYNGTVPGPTLRCKEGDRVRIHFANQSVAEHSMHFHGIHPFAMDGVEMVKPGDTFVYEFDAEPYGLHLYHCHVPPVHLHMGRGLYGAFVVDPPRPRPRARELVMVSAGWDLDFNRRNELYAINGGANFFRDNPIVLRRGERVRLYLVNALEFDPINSFHIHANFFTVLRRTVSGETHEYDDIVTLSQAERRILEFSYKHTGLFMFHAHQNAYAELGGMGHFQVVDTDERP